MGQSPNEFYRVTAEMIEAGRQALLARGDVWEEETLAMMYRAMRALEPPRMVSEPSPLPDWTRPRGLGT